MGHQRGTGHAAVAVKVHQNSAFRLQDFGFKGTFIQLQHGSISFLKGV